MASKRIFLYFRSTASFAANDLRIVGQYQRAITDAEKIKLETIFCTKWTINGVICNANSITLNITARLYLGAPLAPAYSVIPPQLSFRWYSQPLIMIRPRRDTQASLRQRPSSHPRLQQSNNQRKGPRIGRKTVEWNDVNQALAVIAPVSECIDEEPALIPTELPRIKAKCVLNRDRASRCIGPSQMCCGPNTLRRDWFLSFNNRQR